MKLGIDSVPLEHIREALAFAVANGWRPPPPAVTFSDEEPTAKIPARGCAAPAEESEGGVIPCTECGAPSSGRPSKYGQICNRCKHLARQAKYRAANRALLRAKATVYNHAHREQIRQSMHTKYAIDSARAELHDLNRKRQPYTLIDWLQMARGGVVSMAQVVFKHERRAMEREFEQLELLAASEALLALEALDRVWLHRRLARETGTTAPTVQTPAAPDACPLCDHPECREFVP